MQLFVAEF